MALELSEKKSQQLKDLRIQHDPLVHPDTKPVLELLNEDARRVVVETMRAKIEKGLAIGVIFDHLLESSGIASKDVLAGLQDAMVAGVSEVEGPCSAEYERVSSTLAQIGDGFMEIVTNHVDKAGFEIMEIDAWSKAIDE